VRREPGSAAAGLSPHITRRTARRDSKD